MKTEQSDQPASSRVGKPDQAKDNDKDKEKHKHKHKDQDKKAPNKKKINEQKRQKGQEENFKEIYGFFTNQVDVKRFLKQNLSKKDDESDEKKQDEFLNPNEFSEMKGFYDDFNMGDLVIVFQNPDFQDGEGLLKDRGVTFREAEDVFDKVLTVMTDEGVSKSQLKKERDSFLLAFLILDDFKSDQAQQEENEDKKKEEKQRQINKKQSVKVDNNQKHPEAHHQEEKKDLTKHKQKKQQQHLSYAQFLEEYQKYLADLKDDRVSNFDLIKKLLEINLLDKQQFKAVSKRYRQGGFSEKAVTLEQKEYWKCKNNQPKDFQTLIRFTMIAKLCRNGSLHCRQFITTNGEMIIVVIKSSKEVITKEAEKGKNTKQLELGYADLFSLEPVDIKYRPLRLNKWIRDQTSNEELQKKIDEYVSGRREDNLPRLKVIDDSLEEHFRNIYQKVILWDEIDLHALVIKKQIDVDKCLRILQKELNIDLSHEKVELMDEATVSTNEWQCYYIYLEYIHCLVEHVQSLKSKPGAAEVNRNQAFLYKLIFRKALGDANQFWYEKNQTFWREATQDKKLLLNIWDRLSMEPVSPYAEFFKPNNAAGEAMWRMYEINELGWRSEFINMEKIKITQTIVLKNINILKMIQDQHCIKYCPLHDQYQLLGLTKKPLFEPIKAAGYMNKHEQTVGDKAIRHLFNCMKDEAEPTDFDGDSLEFETKFNYKQPWDLNIPTMRDYFGEKIALYFTFVKYYTKQLWYMALIAIISQGIISGAEGQTRASGIIIFSIAIIIWSTFFIEFWKREQVLFSTQYGQQNFEEDEAERPAFEGQYIRSITNDDLNEEFYSPFSRKMKMLLSLSVSFLIIACIIGCVIAIFFLKNYLTNTGADPLVISIVPSLLNSIQINFFNFIYSRLVLLFNDYENHKISSSYENSHIAKIFVFMFVNNFNSFFIISFLESYFSSLNLCKNGTIDKDCFGVLQNQMIIIFGVSFVNNIPELATPLITKYLANRNKEVIDPYIKHAFTPIDIAIQEQLGLENYQENPEIDGTVGDYMELIIQFCYLCLFGLAFPSSYLMAFVSNIAEIQVDKYKLVKICIRPFPQGASNIGNWLIILEVITFLAIFSNAGLIVFTSQTIAKDSQLVVFSTLLVVFLGLKYLIRFLVPDEPESARILGKRHQYVVERVVKGFASAGADSYQQTKFNMKIGGVIYGIIHTENRNESRSNIDE